jgi:hypothetical protein
MILPRMHPNNVNQRRFIIDHYSVLVTVVSAPGMVPSCSFITAKNYSSCGLQTPQSVTDLTWAVVVVKASMDVIHVRRW